MYYKLQDHEKRKISGSITTWHTPFLTMSTIRSAMTEGSCAISGQKAKNRTARTSYKCVKCENREICQACPAVMEVETGSMESSPYYLFPDSHFLTNP